MCYKRIGYNLHVMRQSACLVINLITVDDYATLFNCTPVDRASDSMTLYLSSPRLCFFIVISLDLSVDREDLLRS